MRTALHPFQNRRITVPEYRQEFGSRPIGRDQLAIPLARCPSCFIRLGIRAEAAVGHVTPHFAHPRGTICRTIDFGRGPFEGLEPRRADAAAGRILRASFQRNWRSHYRLLQHLVPKFSVREFETLVERADRQRIWEYVGLPEYLLPYMFVMLADFPPNTGLPKKGNLPGRNFWYRFWFAVPVDNQIDNLWINENAGQHLIRGEFDPPAPGREFPRSDVFDFAVLPIQRGFPAQDERLLSDFIERTVQEIFAR